ncbi:MAG: isoprenyl transferase [Chloroflexota bacterium]|nr:isoprenyl transferase [Chloroflexota bacterium]NOG66083.1 isoprenyl transferase [Chloroflexota bacterium]GIK63893.1 MAG: isoprenyl transferase [Chloroflexota bacterium]
MMNFEPELPANIPYHVGIIMDGNGRWAKQRGLPRTEGHRHGVENLRGVLEACGDFGIKILTIYAFSTENWGRPPAEVRFLLSIIDYFIDRELNALHEKGVKLRHIGKLEGLNPRLKKRIHEALELTRNNEAITLNIAFNYGGRDDIVQAVRQIMRKGIAPEAVTEDLISQHLYTAGQPDPDLIIRTGGDMRLSNFLMWQAAYSEFYSTPTFWPDFNRTELLRAIEYYGARDRRFGLVKEP